MWFWWRWKWCKQWCWVWRKWWWRQWWKCGYFRINIRDFVIVEYSYSCSVNYYIGECISKDSDTELTSIFLERVCGFLFKCRENIIHKTADISMAKNMLSLNLLISLHSMDSSECLNFKSFPYSIALKSHFKIYFKIGQSIPGLW